MAKIEEIYKSLLAVESLKELETAEALDKIGKMVDISTHRGKSGGLELAISWCEDLQKRVLEEKQFAILHYYWANAWMSLRKTRDQIKAWEQIEIENEIIHLRKALQSDAFSTLQKERRCQIYTNLANSLSDIGRFVESKEYLDKAIDLLPPFAMALGNRGCNVFLYAQLLVNENCVLDFLKHSHSDLQKALSFPLRQKAKEIFGTKLKWIESKLLPELLTDFKDIDGFPKEMSDEEIRYREWCLRNRLFLNPLNDLANYFRAANDNLTLPTIVVNISEGPYYTGYFNQMKQEYVSARYLFYEGKNARKTHFSDRDVLLYDTFDYPCYSLAAEKLKVAFRVFYSLFDKIAYFLNHYLNLNIKEHKVKFRTLWYIKQDRKNDLRLELVEKQNPPLKALFWVSKDLFEDKHGFRKTIEPLARDLHDIRNHLEHKYLKIHDDLWPGRPSDHDEISLSLTDTLAHSVRRSEFENKVLRLMRMTRAALIYLCLAINCEERERSQERDPNSIIPSNVLEPWEDDYKI